LRTNGYEHNMLPSTSAVTGEILGMRQRGNRPPIDINF